MFRVIMEYGDDKGLNKRIDVAMKTEKLYELIGRKTVQYGPPVISPIKFGTCEYEYYKEKGNGFESLTLSFCKILKEGRKKRGNATTMVGAYPSRRSVPMGNYTPPPPPTPVGPTETDDPRLSELFTKGMLEAGSYRS